MNRKYELTEEIMCYAGTYVHRIKALRSFDDVKAGDLGGWVESEFNLSHEGNCWIYNNAIAVDNSRVNDNAKMYGSSVICENAAIYNNAEMYNDAAMCDETKLYDDAKMYDEATLFNSSELHDNAEIHNDAAMYDNTKLYNNAKLYDFSLMFNNAKVCNNAEMHGYARMYDNTRMYDYAKMYSNSKMYDNAKMRDFSSMTDNSIMTGNSKMFRYSMLRNDAELKETENLYGALFYKVDKFIEMINPKGRLVTGMLTDGDIYYNVGCQIRITKEKFLNRIYNEDGGLEENPHRAGYLKIIDEIEKYLKDEIDIDK